MNWVVIAAGVIFLASVLIGYSRGFLKSMFSMAQMLIAIFLVLMISPILKGVLRENTSLYDQTKEKVVSAIESELPDLTGGMELPAEMENELIDRIASAEILQELLKKNNTPEVYESLGVTSFIDYIGTYMAELVITAVSFVIAFIAVMIVLQIISLIFDLIGKLPVLGGINRLAGGLLGAAEGLIILWLLCLVATAFPNTSLGSEVLAAIGQSELLSMIYNNNLVLNLMVLLGMKL